MSTWDRCLESTVVSKPCSCVSEQLTKLAQQQRLCTKASPLLRLRPITTRGRSKLPKLTCLSGRLLWVSLPWILPDLIELHMIKFIKLTGVRHELAQLQQLWVSLGKCVVNNFTSLILSLSGLTEVITASRGHVHFHTQKAFHLQKTYRLFSLL